MKTPRNPTTAIFHDTRSQKKDGTYPVKLRVTFQRTQKYYPTEVNLTAEDFKRVFGEKPRKDMKQLRLELEALEQKANAIIRELPLFSFEAFEQKYFSTPISAPTVFSYYERSMQDMTREGRAGNADSYKCSYNSLKAFHGKDTLSFSAVTVDFLKSYEKWMLQKGKSLTSVGIYLRTLRTLFNQAIKDGIVPAEAYPFGKGKYQIPAGRNVKKALKLADIEKIFTCPLPEGSTEQWARDLWLLSYLCNGMNLKDIARLRYRNLGSESIEFVRAKTERTTRKNLKSVLAVLTPEAKAIIDRWGKKPVHPDGYIFDILPENITPERELALVRQAIKTVNKYVGRIAREVGITQPVTTYTARHSFATVLKRSGAPVEFISESLGHSDLKTTENYLAAFEDSVKKEYAAKLMAFGAAKP
jgi:site-specific recombinase XerD